MLRLYLDAYELSPACEVYLAHMLFGHAYIAGYQLRFEHVLPFHVGQHIGVSGRHLIGIRAVVCSRFTS